MTEDQATRLATVTATATATLPDRSTLGPDHHRWLHQPETPSSSGQASDQLTPDSDSGGGDDDGATDEAGPLGRRGAGGYGLQGGSKSGREAATDYGSDDYGSGAGEGSGAGSGAGSTVRSFELYTPDEERAVVRKLDRRLVLFMAMLYMLSFLDRTNIGNARIAGMDDDLQSTPRRDDWYEWALTAFYIAYIAFEWMAILWRLIPAHIFVSVVVLSWGLTASLQAVAVNYPMLIFLRTLLGIGEAAFTGVPFYLSFFFKRHELAFRTAIFISAAPLASTFASSLAWLIVKLGESGPIAPWRLLFLVEGLPSVLAAAVAWNVVPDSPQTASYLTAREKRVAHLRLRNEWPEPRHHRRGRRGGGKSGDDDDDNNSGGGGESAGGLDGRDVLSAALDPVAWLTASIFFLANMAYSSLPVFLPTILTGMGHSPLAAQALAAPPYLLSFATVLLAARASDRAHARGAFIAGLALASAAGYGVLAATAGRVSVGNPWRYAAVFPAAAGFFGVVVLTVAWAVGNSGSPSRRAGGFALLQAVGQCGPLVGTRLYPVAHAPFYAPGMAICAVAMVGVAVLAVGLRLYLARLNRRMDEEAEGAVAAGEVGEAEEAEGLVSRARGGGGGAARDRFRYIL